MYRGAISDVYTRRRNTKSLLLQGGCTHARAHMYAHTRHDPPGHVTVSQQICCGDAVRQAADEHRTAKPSDQTEFHDSCGALFFLSLLLVIGQSNGCLYNTYYYCAYCDGTRHTVQQGPLSLSFSLPPRLLYSTLGWPHVYETGRGGTVMRSAEQTDVPSRGAFQSSHGRRFRLHGQTHTSSHRTAIGSRMARISQMRVKVSFDDYRSPYSVVWEEQSGVR